MTWKIITCTWLDVAEFLTKEPPTGKKYRKHTQSSNFRANILCSQRRGRGLAVEWNKTPVFTDLDLIIWSPRKYLMQGMLSRKKI